MYDDIIIVKHSDPDPTDLRRRLMIQDWKQLGLTDGRWEGELVFVLSKREGDLTFGVAPYDLKSVRVRQVMQALKNATKEAIRPFVDEEMYSMYIKLFPDTIGWGLCDENGVIIDCESAPDGAVAVHTYPEPVPQCMAVLRQRYLETPAGLPRAVAMATEELAELSLQYKGTDLDWFNQKSVWTCNRLHIDVEWADIVALSAKTLSDKRRLEEEKSTISQITVMDAVGVTGDDGAVEILLTVTTSSPFFAPITKSCVLKKHTAILIDYKEILESLALNDRRTLEEFLNGDVKQFWQTLFQFGIKLTDRNHNS